MEYNTENEHSKHEIIPVGRAKDITGEVFGRLTVIGRTRNIKKDTAWLCMCSCGNYKKVRTTALRTGDNVSCGCKRKELTAPHDIKGNRYGRLVAVKLTPRRSSRGEVYWECACDCGNATEVMKSRLSGGHVLSCGCLSKEITSKRQSKSGYMLEGKRFGRLKVIKESGKRKEYGRMWHCECECGETPNVSARDLVGGRVRSCGCKQIEHVTTLGLSNAGKNNPAYNHELTDEQRATNRFQRSSNEAKQLRIDTYKRDGYECLVCNDSHKLIAHHIESFADNIDLRFELNNTATMCESCHITFHKKYGYGNNTREQFDEFYKDNKIIKDDKTLV